MKKDNNYKRAFTLVELLAVIVILGVLLLIAVPSVSNIINNLKEDTFLVAAQSYIQAARTQVIISGADSDALAFPLNKLDVEVENGRYSGVVYAEKNPDTKQYEYSVFIKDTKTKKAIGNTRASVAQVVNDISKYNIISTSLYGIDWFDNVEQFYTTDPDYKVYVDPFGNNGETQELLKNGEFVYLKSKYGSNNWLTFKVISDFGGELHLLFVSDQNPPIGYLDHQLTYFEKAPDLILQYKKDYEFVKNIRLLTLKDLNTYFGAGGITTQTEMNELLSKNANQLSGLFGGKNTTVPSLITMGELDDACRMDGYLQPSYTKEDATCYAIDFNTHYVNSKSMLITTEYDRRVNLKLVFIIDKSERSNFYKTPGNDDTKLKNIN